MIAEGERVRRRWEGRRDRGGEEKKTGCISGAAMVTVIHVVDTLEPTTSLPPVAAIHPPLSLSLSLCGLAGSQCSQLLQKKKPVIVAGNADIPELCIPPPHSTIATILITHSASRPFALRRPRRYANTYTWRMDKHRTVRPRTSLLSFLSPLCLCLYVDDLISENSLALRIYSFRAKKAFDIQTGSWEKSSLPFKV